MKTLPSFFTGFFLAIAGVAGLYIFYVATNLDHIATASDVANGKVFFPNPIQMQTGVLAFDATATETEVTDGFTFYGDSSQLKTGTAQSHIDYSLQSLKDFDDYKNSLTQSEEALWDNVSANIWQDTRTKLYWYIKPATNTNQFVNSNHETCDFFDNNNKENYTGTDNDCGQAVNYCAGLLIDANKDNTPDEGWYLPTQKELQQAYIDGIFNQVNIGKNQNTINSAFVWSATESALKPTAAWAGNLATGAMTDNAKTDILQTYCVTKNT